MKLYKYNSKKLVKYYDKKIVDIPEFNSIPEVRGIWISNVANIDTPKMQDIESYKEYIRNMIQTLKSYNINLMIYQVRPCNDAFYQSKLNTWSEFITGVNGLNPGFDVFEFVCSEAKKENIEVHAWLNPYRVSRYSLDDLKMTKEEYLNTLPDNNFAKINKDDTILDGTKKVILKPSSKNVVNFISDTIKELIENYDITGIHIDDYFYPYAKVPYVEEQSDYEKVSNEISFDDWRRFNVDTMIERIHNDLKEHELKTNKKISFGISPFGIYRTHISLKENGWEKGSFHTSGALQCYSDLYSDIYKWMKNSWIDYVVPQLYFPFERSDVNYHDLLKWWNDISLETNTTLYIGHGLYQMGSNKDWQNPLELDLQLRLNTKYEKVMGSILFTYHDLLPTNNLIKNASISLLKARWNAFKCGDSTK